MILKSTAKNYHLISKHKTPFPSLLQDGMNFGFTKTANSRWDQPVCEEHFQPAREDETLEEIPKVEDLSIRGEGNLQELETVGSSHRAEIAGESFQKGGENSSRAREGKKKGKAKSRRERKGDNGDGDDDDDDDDHEEEGEEEEKEEEEDAS